MGGFPALALLPHPQTQRAILDDIYGNTSCNRTMLGWFKAFMPLISLYSIRIVDGSSLMLERSIWECEVAEEGGEG